VARRRTSERGGLARTYGVRVLRIDADLVERDVRAAVAIVRAALWDGRPALTAGAAGT
jgi:hypothetical protein